MGISISATLGYGFPLWNAEEEQHPGIPWMKTEHEEGYYEGDEEYYIDEWEDFYCKKVGIDTTNYTHKDWNALRNKIGIQIVCFVSYEYPIYYLFAKNSVVACDWVPEEVQVNSHYYVEWKDTLKEFCKTVGLEYKETSWYMGCHYSY